MSLELPPYMMSSANCGLANCCFMEWLPFASSFNMDFFEYYNSNSGFVLPNEKEAEKMAVGGIVDDGHELFQASPSSTLLDDTSSPSENLTGMAASSRTTVPLIWDENAGRRKRRRSKSYKNKEEVENQRMTHIAVERNRRKQMNEYLSALRSLMPPAYVQRGDQASIVGGAINYVKELEQLLLVLEAQKRLTRQRYSSSCGVSFPQMANFQALPRQSSTTTNVPSHSRESCNKSGGVAEVEVTVAESHANVRIVSRRRPRQLLKLAAAFQNLHLTVLHINVTAMSDMVFYSLSVKVEEGCQVLSADEISTAMHQIMERSAAESGIA